MRALLPLALLWACEPDDPKRHRPHPEDGDDDDAVGDDDPGTTTPELCETSPGQEIVSLSVSNGRIANDRQLDVTLAEEGQVAALCSSPSDPSEHLVESSAPGLTHALRLQGLLPAAEYHCKVAPTCPLAQGPAREITVETGISPTFPELRVEVDDSLGMTGYWTLLQFVDGACSWGAPGWLVLYDALGVARWWYRLPEGAWIDVESLYHSEDNAIVWGGGAESRDGRARVVDLWEGDVFASSFPGWQNTRFSHDAKRTADGRLLMLDYRDVSYGGESWWGFGVRLLDPETGALDFDLDSQRYVEEGWLYAPPQAYWEDLYHANWLEWAEHPDGDRLYVSLCYDWSILSIDTATGDVRYKLARGQGWTVLDEQGNEIGENALPQCQHGNEVIGDDVLLVYDNGQGRPYSQVVELAIDVAAHTVTRRWQWSEPEWHEGTLGDVDDLGNGRVLVTEAHPECWSELPGDRSAIVEVDRATGQVASRLTFPGVEHTIYRSERYEGCALMSSTLACPELARRADELSALLGW